MAIALQTAWHANANRDRKRHGRPFPVEDFYCWGDVQEAAGGSGAAGAAMLELAKRGQFPGFALGEWYDELKSAGTDRPLPQRLCWAADDAILLAPYRVDGFTWGGYLIAMAESSGQVREFFNEHGDSLQMIVPAEIGAEAPVETMATALLAIAGSPDRPSSLDLRPL